MPGGPGDTCAAASGTSGGQQGICEFGWTFADDTCFALFGGLDGQEDEWKTWPQADAAWEKMVEIWHPARPPL